MYSRYKKTSIQGLAVNQQIALIVKDINMKLQESERHFRSYKLAASIETGEKAVYKSIALANIMEGYISQTIEKNKNNAELEKGLKELQQHFENLHSLINQYIIKRNKDLYEKTITNLKAMEDFWAGLSMEQPNTH